MFVPLITVAFAIITPTLGLSSVGDAVYAKHDQGLVKALKAQNVADPSYPPCNKGWFDQTLDHSNTERNDGKTWQQQYQSATQFWKKGNPVFLLLGGEGPASCLWLEHNTNVMINAQKFGAAVYQLEHRFYGISQPFNGSSDALSIVNMELLSSQQAIADAATFVTNMLKNVHGNVPVISFGGSYSGALSAWLRLKYPDAVHAAVSTSSPILAIENYSQYQEIVKRSLTLVPADATLGPKCVAGIEAATASIQTMVQTDAGRQHLSKMFNTCAPIASDEKSIANFMMNLAGSFDGVVQYNKDNRAWEHPGSSPPPTITQVCEPFTKTGVAMIQYLQSQQIMTNFSTDCMDVDYPSFIQAIKNTSVDQPYGQGARQWTWQTCVEFGYFQSSDSTAQPFGNLFPTSFSTQQCMDIFGVAPGDVGLAINRTNAFYGAKNFTAERVVFVNGQVDPWHPLSLLPWDLPPTANTSQVSSVLMNDTAHCAIMYPPTSDDVSDLTNARMQVQQKLSAWLTPTV